MSNPTIDACLIVRNEKSGIKRCLIPILKEKAIRNVYVHDTGSTDGTADILQQLASKHEGRLFVERVEPIMWCVESIDGFDHIDFSANRNRVIERSDADWIFIIDGDEEFIRSRATSLFDCIKLAEEHGEGVVGIPVHIEVAGGSGKLGHTQVDPQLRLFKRTEYKYRSPIHNQLQPVGVDDWVSIPAHIPDDCPHLRTSYKGKMAHRKARSMAAVLRWHADAIGSGDNKEAARSASYAAVFTFQDGNFAAAEAYCRLFVQHADEVLERRRGPAVYPLLIECTLRRRALDEAYALVKHAKSRFPLDATLHRMHVSFSLADWVMATELGTQQQDGTARIHPEQIKKPLNAFIERAELHWVPLIYAIMRENFEKHLTKEEEVIDV